jgi:hypothetical protein
VGSERRDGGGLDEIMFNVYSVGWGLRGEMVEG